MPTIIPAYSNTTGTNYTSWEALLDYESNGFLVICQITSSRRNETWPWCVGPFDTKAEAERERARLRAKFKREAARWPNLSYKWFVRPAWKTRAQLEADGFKVVNR